MSDIILTKVGGPNFVRKIITCTCATGGCPPTSTFGEPVGVDGVNIVSCSNAAVTCATATCSNSWIINDGTTYTIRNFETLEFRLESPAGDFPIPETEDFGNIVVKAEGNRLSINVSWTIHEETTNVVCGTCAPTVTTVAQQVEYLLNNFQAYSIEGEYGISVDGIIRRGYIRSLSLSKSASTPVTYSASLDFIAGDVVAGE